MEDNDHLSGTTEPYEWEPGYIPLSFGLVIAAAIGVIMMFAFLSGFATGQDHPKPGTVLTAEVMTQLREAELLIEENERLVAESDELRNSNEYLQGELEQTGWGDGVNASPIQTFIAGPDYSEKYYEMELTPLGLDLSVKARNRPVSRAIDRDKVPAEYGLEVLVQTPNGKPIKLPEDESWARLNPLVMVRISPESNSQGLGYSYVYDKDGNPLDYPVKTYVYRSVEASISPDFAY